MQHPLAPLAGRSPVRWFRRVGASLFALSLIGAQAAESAAEADAVLSPPAVQAQPVRRADFGKEQGSADARHVADWAIDSRDNAGMPFAIVDKLHARVFVFDAAGKLRGASPVLIGSALGDHTVPGIGSRPLSRIRPEEKTTPAGRFVAALDRSLAGEEILWVDYDSGVALHRVVATLPKERRLQRLESSLPVDHRITFGCINVPVNFYEAVVSPAFTGTSGIVYVLPDTRPVREVFGSYDVRD